ncbi:MAG TPA: flagellar hook-basal body complex protein, partial [bacterium]
MMRSLFVAATGMGGQQNQIDTVANNLANVSTIGYKKSRNNFQDLLYQIEKAAGTPSSANTTVPVGIHHGHGVKLVSTDKVFTQGDMKNTGQELDVAIEGAGFFQILQPNGSIAYTRAGNFQKDQNGRVVTQDGFPLEPEIIVPQDARQVQIGLDGQISVLVGEDP